MSNTPDAIAALIDRMSCALVAASILTSRGSLPAETAATLICSTISRWFAATSAIGVIAYHIHFCKSLRATEESVLKQEVSQRRRLLFYYVFFFRLEHEKINSSAFRH